MWDVKVIGCDICHLIDHQGWFAGLLAKRWLLPFSWLHVQTSWSWCSVKENDIPCYKSTNSLVTGIRVATLPCQHLQTSPQERCFGLAWIGNFPLKENLWISFYSKNICFDYLLLHASFLTANTPTTLLFSKSCFYVSVVIILYLWKLYVHLSQYCSSITFPAKSFGDPSEVLTPSSVAPIPYSSQLCNSTSSFTCYCLCACVLFRLWVPLGDWWHLKYLFIYFVPAHGMVQKVGSQKPV